MSERARRMGMFEALPGRALRAVDHRPLAALIDGDAHARCLAVMDELDAPVQTVCYECRLARGDARVDVAVCLPAMRPAGRDDVLGRLGARNAGEPAWQRCLGLLAEWSQPSGSLVPRIPFVCVAFDGPGDPAAVPAPALSLCVDREFFARQLGLPAGPARPASEIAALAGACHERLRGEPLPAAAGDRLAACLADPGVLAKHVSFMVSREPAAFKLDVQLAIDGVAPLLARLGWAGDVARAVAGIRGLAARRDDVQLNLVLDPAVGRGLEVELLTGRGGVTTEDRFALLDRLVAAGHCDPAKAGALRDAWLHPVSRGGDGLIVARSWYLKVRFDGEGCIVEGKAYLGLMPRVLCNPSPRLAAVPPPTHQR